MPGELARPTGGSLKGEEEEEAMVVQEVIGETEVLGDVDEGQVLRLDVSQMSAVSGLLVALV